MQIHVARDGKQLGVFSVEEIRQQLAAGTLQISDLAWYEGAASWAPLSSVPGITATTPASAIAPPASPVVPVTTPPGVAVAFPQKKTETLAVLSLIFSIFGITGFCCGFFLLMAIAGIVCGHLALTRIKQDPQLEGRGLAMAGLVIGYIALASWLVWVVLFGGLAVLQGLSESMMKH